MSSCQRDLLSTLRNRALAIQLAAPMASLQINLARLDLRQAASLLMGRPPATVIGHLAPSTEIIITLERMDARSGQASSVPDQVEAEVEKYSDTGLGLATVVPGC